MDSIKKWLKAEIDLMDVFQTADLVSAVGRILPSTTQKQIADEIGEQMQDEYWRAIQTGRFNGALHNVAK